MRWRSATRHAFDAHRRHADRDNRLALEQTFFLLTLCPPEHNLADHRISGRGFEAQPERAESQAGLTRASTWISPVDALIAMMPSALGSSPLSQWIR